MTTLITGIAVFIGVHLVPSFVSLRDALVRSLGEHRYRGLFSLVALAGLVLIVIGKGRAEFVFVWQPPAWGRTFALIMMLPSMVLLASSHMPTNLKRRTRHPMLWGVVLWSLAHLAANGELASVLLFGGLGAFALLDMWSANRRGAVKSSKRVPISRDLMVLAAGVAAYVAFALAHPYLFGVPVVPG